MDCMVIIYILYNLLHCILSIYALFISPSDFSVSMCFPLWFSGTLFIIQQALIYTFFILKLYVIFKYSAYSYSSKFILRFIGCTVSVLIRPTIPAISWLIHDFVNYDDEFQSIQSFADCSWIRSYQSNTGSLFLGLTIASCDLLNWWWTQ